MVLSKAKQWLANNKKMAIAGLLVLVTLGSVGSYAYYLTFAPIQLNVELSDNAVEISRGVCQDGDPGHFVKEMFL